MELEEYNPNAVKTSGYITSSTPITTGYDPAAGGVQRGVRTSAATPAELIQQYRKMTPALRKALAQQLKDAGFRVPVTGRYDTTVRSAFLSANEALSTEIANLSQNDPQRLAEVSYDLTSFLKNQSKALGGDGEPKRAEYPTVLSRGDVAELLNSVKQDLTGYGATEDEIDFYYEKLRKKSLKQPTVVTRTEGGQTTQRGFNPQQFLVEKISGTDAAKERKVLDAYDAFAQVMGINI
jgi:hypothetical protein